MLFTSPPSLFEPPVKIVSLVPSITELLWHLGLEQETIGITKFCVHPRQWLHEKKRIGGTKNLHVEEIISMNPDLVIASREENVQNQVEAIAEHLPVFLTDIITIGDAYHMIADIGKLTGRHTRANELVCQIRKSFTSIQQPKLNIQHQPFQVGQETRRENLVSNNDPSNDATNQPFPVGQETRREHLDPANDPSNSPTIPTISTIPTNPTIPTIYLIWKDPYMTVGGDTFISNMMQAAGFRNVAAAQTRYPAISVEGLRNSEASLIMLSSEPYPFKQTHADELSSLLPGKRVVLVDGEMFSWYGSRMLEAPKYFKKLRNNLVI